jgi:hypothetical protein
MSRRIAIPAAMIAAVAVCAPAAVAQTTRCSGKQYDLIRNNQKPTVKNIAAVNLPRLTDGYAPRCLVAEAIGGDVQIFFFQHHRLPRSMHEFGAQWDGGVWKLSYANRRAKGKRYQHATARHGRETVTFDLNR